jgi:hypothetical protein
VTGLVEEALRARNRAGLERENRMYADGARRRGTLGLPGRIAARLRGEVAQGFESTGNPQPRPC